MSLILLTRWFNSFSKHCNVYKKCHGNHFLTGCNRPDKKILTVTNFNLFFTLWTSNYTLRYCGKVKTMVGDLCGRQTKGREVHTTFTIQTCCIDGYWWWFSKLFHYLLLDIFVYLHCFNNFSNLLVIDKVLSHLKNFISQFFFLSQTLFSVHNFHWPTFVNI